MVGLFGVIGLLFRFMGLRLTSALGQIIIIIIIILILQFITVLYKTIIIVSTGLLLELIKSAFCYGFIMLYVYMI